MAADQVTGGVVVHHQEDHLTFADQTGHVVLRDVFGRRPEGEGLELPGQFPGLHLRLVAQVGESLAGRIAPFKPVAVNEGEAGRFAGILQVAAKKGEQGAADAPDADGLDFQHNSSQQLAVSGQQLAIRYGKFLLLNLL